MKPIAVALLTMLAFGPLALAAPTGGDDWSVLVVSIDALHPAALSENITPTLHALMRPGRYTLEGQSVDPPKTLVAHTAMLTGLPPFENGKRDNDWNRGEPRVVKPTLFDDAKRFGYRTAFYYAKPKLGYLVSDSVDQHGLAPDDGIDKARAFFRGAGRRMAFLHVSGLEYAGADSGWLSSDYLDELAHIDMALAPLLEQVRQSTSHAIVVTSDHAGHERQHGTQDPEDFKLPLIIETNLARVPWVPEGTWHITDLRRLVQDMIRSTGVTQ
ncbi:MAG: alkaline phosphatase family protein [Sterolibacterium sp.]